MQPQKKAARVFADIIAASSAKNSLTAFLRKERGGSVVVNAQSTPLESKQIAIDLLISFFKQDDKYLNLVEWTPKKVVHSTDE